VLHYLIEENETNLEENYKNPRKKSQKIIHRGNSRKMYENCRAAAVGLRQRRSARGYVPIGLAEQISIICRSIPRHYSMNESIYWIRKP
jgi:hypothetical protein